MLFEIEIPRWGAPALTQDQMIALRDYAVNTVRFEKDDEGGDRLDWSINPIVSAEAMSYFPGAKVLRTVDNASIRSIGQRNTTVVNERCSVAVAGLGLLTVNDVKVRVDLCTEELQRELSEGWRILAVCVQPDQRRPDYVLGRTVVS